MKGEARQLVYSLHAWGIAGGAIDGDGGTGLLGGFACRTFCCVFVPADI